MHKQCMWTFLTSHQNIKTLTDVSAKIPCKPNKKMEVIRKTIYLL